MSSKQWQSEKQDSVFSSQQKNNDKDHRYFKTFWIREDSYNRSTVESCWPHIAIKKIFVLWCWQTSHNNKCRVELFKQLFKLDVFMKFFDLDSLSPTDIHPMLGESFKEGLFVFNFRDLGGCIWTRLYIFWSKSTWWPATTVTTDENIEEVYNMQPLQKMNLN